MNAQMQQLAARLQALPPATRLFGGVLVAVILLGLVIAGIATHQTRVALFAQSLRPEQITEVEERLAEWNVTFSESPTNVLVDASHRNDVLLRLSIAGVPHAHVQTSSETLANVGVLTPEAVIDAQTRAGLAGDIETGLRGVNGVADARVIVAPARIAQFGDESSKEPSASVRLRLHPGAALGASAVAGIRAFVAASVEGLEASHVTILDDRGVALGNASASDDDAMTLQRSLQSALDGTLGAGAALVRVHAEYDRTTTERRETRRAPMVASPLAADESAESYVDGGKRYEKHAAHADRGSDVNETVSHADGARLVRISTAVYVDRTRAIDLPSVRALIAATVGFDAGRGDTLAIQAIDFPHHAAPKRDGWWLAYNALIPLLPVLVIALGCFAVARVVGPAFGDVAKQYIERSAIARTSRTVAGFAPSQVRGALAHEPPHAAAAVISALPAATAAAVLELYPPHEREAIIRRMQRPIARVIPTVEEMLGRHA